MGINHALISRQFEGRKLAGYVPTLDGGKTESGVTIGSGFDIGQRRASTILKSFSSNLANKLVPYAELTGMDAVKALESKPLKVTEQECVEIDSYAHQNADTLLLADWVKATEQDFYSLPDEMQTVIASVAYQYGDLPTQCPMFWKQAVNNDWEGMLRNLWNFGDSYQTRRRQEYMLILWGMLK